jgi:hypothetical protein
MEKSLRLLACSRPSSPILLHWAFCRLHFRCSGLRSKRSGVQQIVGEYYLSRCSKINPAGLCIILTPTRFTVAHSVDMREWHAVIFSSTQLHISDSLLIMGLALHISSPTPTLLFRRNRWGSGRTPDEVSFCLYRILINYFWRERPALHLEETFSVIWLSVDEGD